MGRRLLPGVVAAAVVVVSLGGGVGNPVTLLERLTWPMQLTRGEEGSPENLGSTACCTLMSWVDALHSRGKKVVVWWMF